MRARRTSLVRRLAASLQQHGGLSDHTGLLLAVSGGADSVALLIAMHELRRLFGVRLTVAHLDHQLRGAEGRADAAFVAALAGRLRVPYVSGRSDVRRLAKRKQVSLEMAARDARYRFLCRTACAHGATAVMTAHTADDQAETVLLRLMRGSGPTGLAGIRRVGRLSDVGLSGKASQITLLRPMLDVTRDEVEIFLRQRGEAWREDRSNASPVFLRNRVRHELLPLLIQRFNPAIQAVLCRTADILGEEDVWLDELATEALMQCRDDAGGLNRHALNRLNTALARRVIRLWLMDEGLSPSGLDQSTVERVRALATCGTGTHSTNLAHGKRVIQRYEHVSLEDGAAAYAPFRVALNVPGETILPEQGLRVVVERLPGIVREPGTAPGRLPATASLSSTAVGRRRLYLRCPEPGDRMQPLGMRGSRKLQDIFVDAKIPVDQRCTVPVLACAKAIAWIPGYRIAEPFRVSDPERSNLQVTIVRI